MFTQKRHYTRQHCRIMAFDKQEEEGGGGGGGGEEEEEEEEEGGGGGGGGGGEDTKGKCVSHQTTQTQT